ncbi:RHS repeat-associated core domain-containing protein [Candidatus Cyanaurora vandensis]|uniref:RHS repeat-associated core domain-containing protein n=1 Tax=Candidatus Cyanaurora vandensis TaxID=2714958 RepID=UPI00257B3585|nr:RHS repeat-associated core domain-containing protein [Candidatus Cyanaurora vandensis]
MDGFAYQEAGPLPTYTNFYTNPAASTNNLTFTGREDDGTGVLYYRARYYSPRLQRFISEDPLGFGGGDSNLYRYAGNSPNVETDPLGLYGEVTSQSRFIVWTNRSSYD